MSPAAAGGGTTSWGANGTKDSINSHAAAVVGIATERLPKVKGVSLRRTLVYPRQRCQYWPATEHDAKTFASDGLGGSAYDPVVYAYLYRGCIEVTSPADRSQPKKPMGGVNAEQFMTSFVKSPQTEAQRVAQTQQLGVMLAEAAENLQLPEPEVERSPHDPLPAIVNLPTWWAITNAGGTHTSSIDAGGVIQVNVAAKAVASEWEASFEHKNNGKFSRCEGLGITWYDGIAEDHPDACTYTYTYPKRGETATVATLWDATFSVTVEGRPLFTNEPLPDRVATESKITLDVLERHALVTK